MLKSTKCFCTGRMSGFQVNARYESMQHRKPKSPAMPILLRAVLVVLGLAKRKWDISVFDHVLNLSSHYISIRRGPVACSYENLLVKVKRINQYITNTGQNTGTSNMENHVHTKPIVMALVAEYQNLNSGNLRIKGLNSSSCFVGRPPAAPSSMSLSITSFDGSNLG
jgi:hypothetical protein